MNEHESMIEVVNLDAPLGNYHKYDYHFYDNFLCLYVENDYLCTRKVLIINFKAYEESVCNQGLCWSRILL